MSQERIDAIFDETSEPDHVLERLMEVLGEGLDCDRCLLFLRDPHTKKTRMTHQWVRDPAHAMTREGEGWEVEPASLPDDDPMYREALTNPVALYIDDIETADPDLVNAPYEREHFGHRALVHAPVYDQGLMYGIIEPCVFDQPRAWSTADRALVEHAQERSVAAVLDYVKQHCR